MRIASPITILSGFITRRIVERSRSRRISFIEIRSARQALDVIEHGLGGEGDVEQRARDRARGREDLALHREHLVQPPAGDVGERQQPQRFARRRAVDHDHVPLAGAVVSLEAKQREQLVHPRRHRQLLRGDPVDAALEEHLAEPLLHPGPVALHLLLRLDLLAPQQIARARGLRRQLGFERFRQAVCRVGGDHKRAQARRSAATRRAGGHRGLADPALAGVEDRSRPRHRRESMKPGASRRCGRSCRRGPWPRDEPCKSRAA